MESIEYDREYEIRIKSSEELMSNLADYWDGYRSAYIEALMLGLEQLEVKYHAEKDTDTPYMQGFRKGLMAVTDRLTDAIRKDAAIRRGRDAKPD